MTRRDRAAAFAAAALLAFLGGGGAGNAQTQCGIGSTATASAPHLSTYVQSLHQPALPLGQAPRAIYNTSAMGVIRWDLTLPASPVPKIFQIGALDGGPVPTDCDCYQGPTNLGVWEEPDGSGRIVTDWHLSGQGATTSNHGQALFIAGGGAMSFGQQLNPDGNHNILGQDYPIVVLKTSSGNFFAYMAGQTSGTPYLYRVNVTAMTGHAYSAPIVGVPMSNWQRVSRMAAVSSGANYYIFMTTVSGGLTTLHAVEVLDAAGDLVEVAATSYVGGPSVAAIFDNGKFLVFGISGTYPAQSIAAFEYIPGGNVITSAGQANPPSGSGYIDLRVISGAEPILAAKRITSNSARDGFDFFGTGFVGGSGSPAPAVHVPPDARDINSGWEFFIPPSTPTVGYLYYFVGPTVTGAEPLLKAQKVLLDCFQPARYDVTAPAYAFPGNPVSVTVTALDSANNVAGGYVGTVHFLSTDPVAILPPDYTFTSADAGSHEFPAGVTLETVGSQSITAIDAGNGGLTGSTNVLVVPPAQALHFYTIAPCRLLDTRGLGGVFGGPPLQGGGAVASYVVSGNCGIPVDASAFVANITVINPGAAGDLRCFTMGTEPPGASTINFIAAKTRANGAIVPLVGSPSGLSIKTDIPTGSTNCAVDIVGYFR